MRWFKLVGCIALPLVVGGISGYVTVAQIPGWYAGLRKPFFNPPNYLFGPVWTVLYVLMGIGLYNILQAPKELRKNAQTLFIIQMTFNFFWSLIFFGLHQVGLALLDILLLWATILMMIRAMYPINKFAALLQIPYILWVSFATVLNTAILILN